MKEERSNYIPTLDGWRAIAIVTVLLAHGLDPQMFPRAYRLGHGGVLIFFGISGFLITSRLLDEVASRGRISFRNFYLRRAFRILPPSLVYLLTIAVLAGVGIVDCPPRRILYALGLIINYAPVTSNSWYTEHFWSLSVEEHFYLIWPAALAAMGVVRARWLTPLLALAFATWHYVDGRLGLIVRAFAAPHLTYNAFRSDYVADTLLWGCALAMLFRWKRPKLSSPLADGLAVAILALIGFGLVHEIRGFSMGVPEAMHALVIVPIVATVAAPQGFLGRLLEADAVRFIGRLSYSIYLWQQLFLKVPAGSLLQRFPLNIVAIFLAALGSYYLVERPLIRLGQSIVRRGSRPQGAAVVGT